MRGLGGEVFAHHPGRRRILARGKRGQKRYDFGPGKPGIGPESTPNSPIPTQIGPGLARKSPRSARVWFGGVRGGVLGGGGAGELVGARGKFLGC